MFKYMKAFFRGAYKIIFAYPKICRYAKHSEKYPIEVRYAYARKLIKIIFKSLNVKVEANGLEKINKDETYYFVSNHQGVMDALTMIYLFEEPMTFVSKIESLKYPIVGKVCKMIDVFFMDRDNIRDAVKMIKNSERQLNDGLRVMIYPEGTRTKDDNYMTGEYKPGALKAAFSTKKKMASVVIDGSYKVLSKKYKKDLVVKLEVLDIYDENDYASRNTTELASEIQTKTNAKLVEFHKEN